MPVASVLSLFATEPSRRTNAVIQNDRDTRAPFWKSRIGFPERQQKMYRAALIFSAFAASVPLSSRIVSTVPRASKLPAGLPVEIDTSPTNAAIALPVSHLAHIRHAASEERLVTRLSAQSQSPAPCESLPGKLRPPCRLQPSRRRRYVPRSYNLQPPQTNAQ